MKSVCKWGRYLISSKHNLSETLCLTWSPFLIEHLYLVSNWHGLQLRMKSSMNFLEWDWTICFNHITHSRFNNEHNWEGLRGHLKTKRIFRLWPLIIVAFHQWIWNLKWQFAWVSPNIQVPSACSRPFKKATWMIHVPNKLSATMSLQARHEDCKSQLDNKLPRYFFQPFQEPMSRSASTTLF